MVYLQKSKSKINLTQQRRRVKYTEGKTRGRCEQSGKYMRGSKREHHEDKTDLQSKTGNEAGQRGEETLTKTQKTKENTKTVRT